MKTYKLFLYWSMGLLIGLGCLGGCGSPSPKEVLKTKGIPFSYIEFSKRVKNGDAPSVKLFLQAGIDVKDAKEAAKVLQAAVDGGHPRILEMLVKAGLDVDTPITEDGMTLLMNAAKRGAVKTLGLLLDAGARINKQDDYGNTALLQASVGGQKAALVMLLNRKADPNLATFSAGSSALAAAAHAGNTEFVKLLLAAKADANLPDKKLSMTPLAVAAFRGHEDTVKALIEGGADLDVLDKSEFTPLMHAAYHGHKDVVTELVAGGADINKPGAGGSTPLISAVLGNHFQIVKELLKAGVDTAVKNNQAMTALTIAKLEKKTDLVEILLEAAQPSSGGPDEVFIFGKYLGLPPGWRLYDRFTDKTPYWPEYTLVSTVRDTKGMKRVFIRSPIESQMQLFLISGAGPDWHLLLKDKVKELREHPLAEIEEEEAVQSADGVEILCRVYRIKPGIIAGKDIKHMICESKDSANGLVVDAGGPSESFEKKYIKQILTSLNISRKQ